MFGSNVRFPRTYRMVHLPTGKVSAHETVRACTLSELLAQVNEWNRHNPTTFVYYVPERTQPEIGDLNVKEHRSIGG